MMNNGQFICKFCGRVTNIEEETSAHKRLCRRCYANIVRYKRILAKDCVTNDDIDVRNEVETICRSNVLSRRYVPSSYTTKKRNEKGLA